MTPKVQFAIGGVILIIAAFAAGRYLTPVKVVTEVKTVEVEKKVKEKDTDTKTNTHVVTKKETLPDGRTIEVIQSDTISEKTQKLSEQDTKKTDAEARTESTRSGGITALSALAGVNVSDLNGGPVFGGAISRTIIGPLSVGAFGLSNGTVGVSAGLSF